MTVHGSHGVTVQDNVGYHTHGHCYFLEDGGEKDTILNGNLGLSTMKGLITPSDIEVACLKEISQILQYFLLRFSVCSW